MKTDYIDILQLHNPGTLPDPEDPDSLYGGLLEAQKKGWIRFIGITNHRNQLAWDAVLSGKYDTLQFPFSSISDEKDIALAELARDHDMGFIAMKGTGRRSDHQRADDLCIYETASMGCADLGHPEKIGIAGVFGTGKEPTGIR